MLSKAFLLIFSEQKMFTVLLEAMKCLKQFCIENIFVRGKQRICNISEVENCEKIFDLL